jgi:hypothetical protein
MNLINIYFFFRIFINYDNSIEKLYKGHLESADIDSDKLTAPKSLISLLLYLNYLGEKIK